MSYKVVLSTLPDRRRGGWLVAFLFFLTCLMAVEPARARQQKQITSPVTVMARDSLIFHLGRATRAGTLHGDASVTYDDSHLSAWEIDLLLADEQLHARGLQADTGWVGKPRIVQGEDEFTGTQLAFSLQTQRGRVVGAQTRYEEGFIAADVVKALEDSTLFIRNGVYTTCSCVEDPSYSLRSNRMKMVDRKWIYTGPIQLYLFNIPTPLWLPFGFLPAQDNRRSGPLPPTYGEDEFGFYLRDWGWYFAMNDFMDLQLQGGFWTRGSWESRALYRYRKQYAFDGQLRVEYGRFRNGERGDPGFSIRRTNSLRWTHNQTIGQRTSFNANVNLSSSSYLRAVSQDYDDRIRQDIQSSLKFSKRWSGQNLSIQASQRQQLSTGQVSLTLPSLSFSQRSFKPFERTSPTPGSRESIRDKLTVSYRASVNNRFNFQPLPDEELLARGDTLAA
ncbi:MAG: putative LPS assembly protein LptD, partial [Bacteroidota bacterium]|nr:putative LPS assembly protein LptD [Bacteroidota bacterium]